MMSETRVGKSLSKPSFPPPQSASLGKKDTDALVAKEAEEKVQADINKEANGTRH